MAEPIGVHIRWLIRRDVPDFLRIEQASFDPCWSEDDLLRCMRQRNCIGMVAERRRPDCNVDDVIGYMIYELRNRSIHVINFAVDPAYRRRTVGQQMIAKLLSKLSAHRRVRITLEVRESNLAAQLFFRRMGFLATDVLRGFYEDSDEDAYEMTLRQYEEEEAHA